MNSLKAHTISTKSLSEWNLRATLLVTIGLLAKRTGNKGCGCDYSPYEESKELDDNSPTKNEVKDARVISRLIEDGCYSETHLSEGIYHTFVRG
ncbi:hypothetical protein [Bacillus sp. B15-48]|uniref:hypothetical protein n=1 Tax=Bacillus sp. B15-48 TaxID=1548601 RepID=UPI00193F5149|nr:hypothetical protein [Bacillus sp. B15-48]MBM4764787.1 hypothetical protein [Bacillus sp. B15-48]